jgi:hypothetical protein
LVASTHSKTCQTTASASEFDNPRTSLKPQPNIVASINIILKTPHYNLDLLKGFPPQKKLTIDSANGGFSIGKISQITLNKPIIHDMITITPSIHVDALLGSGVC